MAETQSTIPTGPAAAAFVAAGVGCALLGAMTTLAEVSPALKKFLNWWDPAGPLAGKTGMAVMLWLITWVVLHRLWKPKTIGFGRAYAVSLILIALGVLGTFPPFFEAFAH